MSHGITLSLQTEQKHENNFYRRIRLDIVVLPPNRHVSFSFLFLGI